MAPARLFRFGVLALAALAGCPANDGIPPPLDGFFFPIAAAVGHGGRWLYVVNSDFDLRYNGGTVVSVDLTCVRARIADRSLSRCAAITDSPAIRCVTDPGAPTAQVCASAGFVNARETRRINPFAVDAAWAEYPDRQRLYVAVRGDGSVTWFNTDARGGLDCGATSPGGLCTDGFRAGNDTSQSPTAARLPPDPSGLSVDPARGWIAVSHQSTDVTLGGMSLLRDPAAAGGGGAPVLLNVVSNVSPGLSGLTLLPRASAADPSRSTWIVTSRTEASLSLFQAYPGNPALRDAGPFLYRGAIAAVTGLNNGANSRAVTLDPRSPTTRAFVVSRSPEALLTIRMNPQNPADMQIVDATPVPAGPSRVVAADDGARTLVYVASYDARTLTVIDPDAHQVVDEVRTNRGPHAMAIDTTPGQAFLYLVDFLDGALEVFDLRPTVQGAVNPAYNRRVLTLAPALPGVTQ